MEHEAPAGLGGRFDVRRRLGAGGMGVVYEAFDHERGEHVALKFVMNVEPSALLRFKNEFRELADIRHPNVVRLHELLSIEDAWCFTMELVDGVDLLTWVRGRGPSTIEQGISATVAQPREAQGTPPPASTAATPSGGRAGSQLVTSGSSRSTGQLDEGRLRTCMGQLALGIAHLHANRRLHRDVKPSNVLVDHSGRAVLCDFSVARRIGEEGDSWPDEGLVGTPSYMSPEQAGQLELTEASDWYSFGVVLFECLTGRVPLEGEQRDMLLRKQFVEIASPKLRDASLPDDLCRLCEGLLRIRPELRPGEQEIFAVLGLRPGPARGGMTSTRATPFVGRERELGELDEAFAAVRSGRAVTVLLTGPTGVGKTGLITRFLAAARSQQDAMILHGRCYERESVPFKAFDSAIDALSVWMHALPRSRAEALVPRDVAVLARLFPVLRRVRAIAAPPFPAVGVRDPHEAQRRAFAALRELLRNIAADERVVLAIEDLHWSDRDSVQLLREVMRPPDAPPILLIASYRGEEADLPTLAPLIGAAGRESWPATLGFVRTMELGPLLETDAAMLARAMLGSGDHVATSARIAREAGGNPFFVAELARWAQSGGELDGDQLCLDDVLLARVEQLPAAAARLLTAVAVAGRPVPSWVAMRAAELDDGGKVALAHLRLEHHVRTHHAREREELLECYHDRLRQVVVGALAAAELREWHGRIAGAYEERGNADAEALAEHWRAAGNHARAAENAAVAAAAAAEAFAFDRAVRLYQLALALGTRDDRPDGDASGPRSPGLGEQRERDLRIALGDALANAGRGVEAAEEWGRARVGADAAVDLELRRRAAQQWLYTGHFDRGMVAVGEVLAAVGLALAPTPQRALLSLLVRRAGVRLSGLRWTPRDPSQVSAEVLSKVDILWSVATGLSMIDTVRGADFQARHMQLSLKVGEPRRVSRSLAMESAYTATGGTRTRARSVKLAAEALRLAHAAEDQHSIGWAHLVSGCGAFLRGEWKAAHTECLSAERIFREHCVGAAWELTNAAIYATSAVGYMGDLGELSRLMPERMREAEQRGNLYMINWLRTGISNHVWLAADDPDYAWQSVEMAAQQWKHPGFHVQHYFCLWARCQVHLYRGDGAAAWELINEQWSPLERSLLLRVQFVHMQALHLRARCALAAVAAAPGRPDAARLLARARHDGKRLLREPDGPWIHALGHAISGAVEAHAGRASEAATHLDEAERLYRAADMRLFAAAVRYQRAGLGGSERATESAAAEEELRGLGIANPARMAATLAPMAG